MAQINEMDNEHRRQAAPATMSVHTSTPTSSDSANLKRANMTRFQNAEDDVASPSAEYSHDPAPTRHEPMTEDDRVLEKGKYEAAEPFRLPRGKRL